MEEKQQLSFGADVSISFFSQILIFGLSAVSSIIIARMLGPQGKGIYTLVIAIPGIISAMVSMGLNFSNIYFIGKKKFTIGTIIGNSFVFSIVFGAFISLVCISAMPFFRHFFLKGAPEKYLYITLYTIPLLLITENIYYILLGHRYILRVAAVSLVRPASYLVLISYFYFFEGISVLRMIQAYVFSLIIVFILGLYFFEKCGFLNCFSLNKKAFSEGLWFGIKQHLGTISQFLNYRLDFLIVAYLLDTFSVGLYSIAVLVGETVWYISKSFGLILYPKIAASDTQRANQFTPLICRNVVFFTLLAVLFLFVVSDWLIPVLFTEKFFPSVIALKLLLPGIFFMSIARILSSDLIGRGFPEYSTIASFACLIVTIAMDLILIPRLGINGASLASSLAYAVNALAILIIFKKKTGIKFLELLIIKFGDFSVYKRFIGALKWKR